jgi:hypothetical protein
VKIDATERTVCVIPRGLAGQLEERMRGFFASRSVEVVSDRRSADRRSGGDRRSLHAPYEGRERRGWGCTH